MRGLRALVASLVVLASVGATGSARALQAPDFDLPAPLGAPWRGRIHLREQRGKVVLLVFWAGSCRTCHADLVALERLHRRYRDQGLVVVGIATDDARATPALAGTVRRLGLTFPIVADPGGRTCVRYDPLRAFPLGVLVGRRGELVRSVELRSRARLQALQRAAANVVRFYDPDDPVDDDVYPAEADEDREPRRERRARPRRSRDDDGRDARRRRGDDDEERDRDAADRDDRAGEGDPDDGDDAADETEPEDDHDDDGRDARSREER